MAVHSSEAHSLLHAEIDLSCVSFLFFFKIKCTTFINPRGVDGEHGGELVKTLLRDDGHIPVDMVVVHCDADKDGLLLNTCERFGVGLPLGVKP